MTIVVATALWAVWPRHRSIAQGDRPLVVTTTNFLTDTVQRVAGSHVDVHGLLGPGVDPHLYKPTSDDLERLREADLVVSNGLHLEGKLEEVFVDLQQQTTLVRAGDAIPRERLLKPPGGAAAGEYDPHVWFDVQLWQHVVGAVGDALAELDGRHASAYHKRARGYSQQLDRLDRRVRDQMAAIPAQRRVLVTSHDAFRYFGRAYDVDVVAIQGISTAQEATTGDIDRVAAVIAGRGVHSIFVESSVSPRTQRAVLAGARDRGASVRLGGQLYADAAGAADTASGSYIGMLQANLRKLVRGLR